MKAKDFVKKFEEAQEDMVTPQAAHMSKALEAYLSIKDAN